MELTVLIRPVRWMVCQWSRLLTGLAVAAMAFTLGVSDASAGLAPTSPAPSFTVVQPVTSPQIESPDAHQAPDDMVCTERLLVQAGQRRVPGAAIVDLSARQPGEAPTDVISQRAPPHRGDPSA